MFKHCKTNQDLLTRTEYILHNNTRTSIIVTLLIYFYRCVYRSCGSCGDHIAAGELVMRAGECVFHEQCFVCVVCGIRLCTGDQYVIKHSQLFCRPDYEKEVNMMRDEINRNTGQ
jgi:hypothetical protein